MNESLELKKPEEVFKIDQLPDDLKWLISEFKLPADDPLLVLLAWHWKRVQSSQDVLQNGLMQMRGVFQDRIDKLEKVGQLITGMQTSLLQVDQNLKTEHLHLKSKIEAELKVPLEQSQKRADAIAGSLEKLLLKIETSWQETHRKRLRSGAIAAFAAGLLLGLCASLL